MGDTVLLGGTLTQATTIAQAGNNIMFTGSGNVGIGTATPASKLDVAGSVNSTANITAAGSVNGGYVTAGSSGMSSQGSIASNANISATGSVQGAYVASTGGASVANTLDVGVNINAPNGSVAGKYLIAGSLGVSSQGNIVTNGNIFTSTGSIQGSYIASAAGGSFGGSLDVGGNINCGATITAASLAGSGNRYVYCSPSGAVAAGLGYPSDRRLKNNILPLTNSLNKVMTLRPIAYDWIDKKEMGDHRQIGFIAQELQKVVPEVVYTENRFGIKDLHTVNYEQLTALLTSAMQELNVKVAALEKENAQLKTVVANAEAKDKNFAELAAQVKEMQQMLGLNPLTTGAKVGKK